MDFFLCNKRKIAVKPTIHQNSAASKTFLGKFENHLLQMLILNPEIIAFLADIGYLVKILNNRYGTFRLKNLENITNFES